MIAILDTQALLYAVLQPSLLPAVSARIIADENNVIFVSAASAWEIATKVRIGKLPEATTFESAFLEILQIAGYDLVPIDAADALRAGRLLGEHRDPFDRMIAAQALARDIPVIGGDDVFARFGVRRIWD